MAVELAQAQQQPKGEQSRWLTAGVLFAAAASVGVLASRQSSAAPALRSAALSAGVAASLLAVATVVRGL